MLRKIASLFISAAIICGNFSFNSVFAETTSSKENTNVNKTVAFPGAEGGGMFTSGARGALENGDKMEVYHVTNLNDSGEGSFRDAVSKGNRIVVFDVSGYIDLKSNVNVGGKGGNLTILGQTAPGDGVCFRGNNIKVSGENIILRYLRFRVGDKLLDSNNALVDTKTQDGLEIVDDTKNVIVDHCSVSWGTDENLSAYAVENVTIQNSIIAEALNQSIHEKGEHSYAAIWGGVNLSVIRNLIATHKSRNPKIGTSETTSMTAGYTDADTLVDIRNNVFYNWGDKAGYGAENDAQVNIINNWYKPGPSTGYKKDNGEIKIDGKKRARIFEYSAGVKYNHNYGNGWGGKVYANGNHIDVTADDPGKTYADTVNTSNYQNDIGTGVYVDPKYPKMSHKDLQEPNNTYIKKGYIINETTAETAYDYVIENAGARLPKLDKVDERIINDVINRTAPNTNNKEGELAPNEGEKSYGLVDSPIDTIPENDKDSYDDRGYPKFENAKRADTYDKDNDGIPDDWETKMGLNKDNPNDSLNIGPGGYTWLEIYTEDIIKGNIDGTVTFTADKEAAIQTDTITLTVTDTDTNNTYSVYCNGEEVITDSSEKSITLQNLPLGENYITVKATSSDGKYSFSSTKVIYVYGENYSSGDFTNSSETGGNAVVSEENGSFYMYSKGIAKAAVQKENIEGNFTFSTSIDYASNIISGAQTGISITSGDKYVKLYKTYDNNNNALYNLETKLNAEAAVTSKIENDAYKENTIRIEKVDGKLSLKLGSSAALLKDIFSNDSDFSGNVTVEVYTLGVENKNTISKFENITFISAVTQPTITMNIKDNQKLDLNTTIEVEVTPDGADINEIAVFFKGSVIKDLIYESGLKENKVSIPITFDTATEGELRVVCFDKKLGMADVTANIVTSADITPWQTHDIGTESSDMTSYVKLSNDGEYTYNLYSSEGNISGNSDKYGYMYQEFNSDARLYFRIRPQSSKDAGIMLKDNFDADGVSYFFGVEPNQTATRGYIYVLKARKTKGGEYETITSLDTMQDDKYYIIVEKTGNNLKIYRTDGSTGANRYKTKELLAETTISLNNDNYYMGLAATKGGADIGWTAIESIRQNNSDSYVWDMDHGLDWWWQYPKNKTIVPSWSNEDIGGNSTGKLLIAPDSNYSEKDTILREYKIENGSVDSGFDIYLDGDKPSVNLRFKTDEEYAYSVNFNTDNTVSFGGTKIKSGEADFKYSPSTWYKVKISTEIGSDKADISLYNSDDTLIAEQEDVSAENFTINTVYNKNLLVKQGFFITPAENSQSRYYIDNMYVELNIRNSLEKAINDAKALNENDYRAKSWIDMLEVLKSAESVFANENATKSEILDATSNLINAVNALLPIKDKVENESEATFWNFSDEKFTSKLADIKNGITVIDNLTLNFDSKAALDGKAVTFEDGTAFAKRLAAGGGSDATKRYLEFNAPANSIIKVYANAKSDNAVTINDGTAHTYTLTGTNVVEYDIGSEAKTVKIYGNIYYFGIKCVPYTSSDYSTRILSYDKTTGNAKIYNGTNGLKGSTAAIGVIVYDDNGKMLEVKKQDFEITAELETEQEIQAGTVTADGNIKVILWDNIENMKPLCESFEVK